MHSHFEGVVVPAKTLKSSELQSKHSSSLSPLQLSQSPSFVELPKKKPIMRIYNIINTKYNDNMNKCIDHFHKILAYICNKNKDLQLVNSYAKCNRKLYNAFQIAQLNNYYNHQFFLSYIKINLIDFKFIVTKKDDIPCTILFRDQTILLYNNKSNQ